MLFINIYTEQGNGTIQHTIKGAQNSPEQHSGEKAHQRFGQYGPDQFRIRKIATGKSTLKIVVGDHTWQHKDDGSQNL